MRMIPVVDVMNGVVVRGVGGRRAEYRPLVSRLTNLCEPLAVARAFREHFRLTELYVADLDAIAGTVPDVRLYERLRDDGFRCWVDAGVRDVSDARRVAAAGVAVVVGLETVRGPETLLEIVATAGHEGVALSLDLRDGEPLGDRAAWANESAFEIAVRAVVGGVERLIVLDLARVGSGAGTGTELLAAELKRRWPACKVIVGGGVRGPEDLHRLQALGIDGALVASALHDGSIVRDTAATYR